MAELLLKDEVYAIIGAAMEVYNQLGPGFGEAIYQDAMEIELKSRKIPNVSQQDVFVFYKGQKLKNFFKPDLICYEKVVVELKALDQLTSREETQLLNYLKATGLPVGVLVNFGGERNLEWKRMVLTPAKSTPKPKILTPQKPPRINDPKPIDSD
ncbi:MAG: GxxExxY protein [Chloroflexota bacterium]|nr:GxxExxY protein [Chloroflexota bacterium]MBI5704029.1 GxxExxY protein [Chloroflexota bacterium]